MKVYMKVYIVTDGDYSDYRIMAAFSTKEKAFEFNHDMDRIEEYNVDEPSCPSAKEVFQCQIDLLTGIITERDSYWDYVNNIRNTDSIQYKYINTQIQRYGSKSYATRTFRSLKSQDHAQALAEEFHQGWLRYKGTEEYLGV